MMYNLSLISIFMSLSGLVPFKTSAALQSAAAVQRKAFDFVVGVDGDFKAAMAAAASSAASGKRFYLFFPNGKYDIGKLTGDANQMTTFSTSNVSFIGENADSTVIFNQSINEGISVTSTLYFNKANNLYLQDLSILNKANYRNGSNLSITGRHVAIKEQGENIIYKNVKLLSTQDTYYTLGTRTYWEDGEIHGTVDFICGQGDVFFNKCLLYLERDKSCITAPATKTTWGYVFMNCTIDGTGSDHLLGRSWRNSPKCVYINTTMKKLPSASAWGDPMNVVPALFAEFNSKTSTGSSVDLSGRRKTFTKDGTTVTLNPVLSASQAAQYTIANVLKGNDNWQPDLYSQQISAPVIRLEGTTLKWNDNDSALCWVVFRNKKFFKNVTTNSCEIQPDASSQYFVRTANAMGGLGSASNLVVGEATSVIPNQHSLNDRHLFHWDQTRKTLSIQGLTEKNCLINIYSLNGKSVLLKRITSGPGTSKNEISLDGLRSGIYLFKSKFEGVVESGQINLH